MHYFGLGIFKMLIFTLVALSLYWVYQGIRRGMKLHGMKRGIEFDVYLSGHRTAIRELFKTTLAIVIIVVLAGWFFPELGHRPKSLFTVHLRFLALPLPIFFVVVWYWLNGIRHRRTHAVVGPLTMILCVATNLTGAYMNWLLPW